MSAPIPFPFPATVTTQRDRESLLREIGALHLELRDMRERVQRADRLRIWIEEQEIIFSPSLCCAGKEVEQRIADADALSAIDAAKGARG